MSPMRRTLLSVGLGLTLLVAGCGSDDGGDSKPDSDADAPSASGDTSPCDLTSDDTVAEVFGGTVESSEEGQARNCEYTLSGAPATLVEVYYFGTADDWDALKSGYESNRGPLTPVDVGDDAFYPSDLMQNEYVVLAGDTVFAVNVADYTTTIFQQVAELAEVIAGQAD